ncbi:hypothetical protein ANN_18548 [Periplaneta americana]|uniref:Uncharacterized protein n=1 Tax=Periplaneta americana TaxID=6978 RepID=A0ABQ8SP21_PERAM|nr:hypothetical protein ANN_18548 [Periplaneta americana]
MRSRQPSSLYGNTHDDFSDGETESNQVVRDQESMTFSKRKIISRTINVTKLVYESFKFLHGRLLFSGMKAMNRKSEDGRHDYISGQADVVIAGDLHFDKIAQDKRLMVPTNPDKINTEALGICASGNVTHAFRGLVFLNEGGENVNAKHGRDIDVYSSE